MTFYELSKEALNMGYRLVKIDCCSCEHWGENICKYYKETPPEHIQKKGCESWVEAIPF